LPKQVSYTTPHYTPLTATPAGSGIRGAESSGDEKGKEKVQSSDAEERDSKKMKLPRKQEQGKEMNDTKGKIHRKDGKTRDVEKELEAEGEVEKKKGQPLPREHGENRGSQCCRGSRRTKRTNHREGRESCGTVQPGQESQGK